MEIILIPLRRRDHRHICIALFSEDTGSILLTRTPEMGEPWSLPIACVKANEDEVDDLEICKRLSQEQTGVQVKSWCFLGEVELLQGDALRFSTCVYAARAPIQPGKTGPFARKVFSVRGVQKMGDRFDGLVAAVVSRALSRFQAN
jgi:hypothetical protein